MVPIIVLYVIRKDPHLFSFLQTVYVSRLSNCFQETYHSNQVVLIEMVRLHFRVAPLCERQYITRELCVVPSRFLYASIGTVVQGIPERCAEELYDFSAETFRELDLSFPNPLS